MTAKADFTDVTAEDNPDWRIDLNDEVIGRWRTDGDRTGDVTLIWGLPLVRGAVAVTAELDGELLDQAPVRDGRFTLVAVDAIRGFGDDLFVTVRLWDRSRARGRGRRPLRRSRGGRRRGESRSSALRRCAAAAGRRLRR